MKNWEKLATVPVQHLKTIGFGALKGKSDISPQWRIKAMTEVYGECGIGWYHRSGERWTTVCENGEIMAFCEVHVYTATSALGGDSDWSAPIVGLGGNKIISKNKNGLVPNDEGWKMAYTDALGTALKCLGVASEVYEGNFDGSKYRASSPATPQPKEKQSLTDCTDLIAYAVKEGWDIDTTVKAAKEKYEVSTEMEIKIVAELEKERG